jgi:hypothetical protein
MDFLVYRLICIEGQLIMFETRLAQVLHFYVGDVTYYDEVCWDVVAPETHFSLIVKGHTSFTQEPKAVLKALRNFALESEVR